MSQLTGDPSAPQQTKANWSADATYVAISVRAGRTAVSTDIYAVTISGIEQLRPLPLSDEIRRQHFPNERPSNGGTVFGRWIDNQTVEIIDNAYGKRITYRINNENWLEINTVGHY